MSRANGKNGAGKQPAASHASPDSSTQLSPTPRSQVTPTRREQKLWSSAQSRAPTSLELLSPMSLNPLEAIHQLSDCHLSSPLWCTPRRSPMTSSNPELSVLQARKTHSGESLKFQLRKELRSSSREKIAARPDISATHILELEKDLKTARNALSEKEELVSELQEIITELEGKMKADRHQLTNLQQENQQLTEALQRTEKDLKAKFAAEIQRLTELLSDNTRHFKELRQSCAQKTVKATQTPHRDTDSSEFCMYLIEENKKLQEEVGLMRASLKQNFESLLGSLVEELAGIRYDVVQLRTLMRCVKAGEQVQLDVFWGAHRPPEEKSKPGNYTTDCLKEVTTIKVNIADMKKVASDVYAEQCGHVCNMQ